MHRPRIAEADLDLRRMNVDVDRARVDVDEHQVGGVAIAVQHVGVGLAQRVAEQAVAHEPAVDEDVLRIAAAARLIGRAEVAAHAQARGFRMQRARGAAEIIAEDRTDPACRRRGGVVPGHAVAVAQRERDVRAGEGNAVERVGAVRELRGFGLQELPARRGVEVEIRDLDRRPERMRRRLDRARRAALGARCATRAPCPWCAK